MKNTRRRGERIKKPENAQEHVVRLGYVCRISRSNTLQILTIPTDVKCFDKVLKCMDLTLESKEINDDDVLDDLQEAGVHKYEDLTIVSNCIKIP
ncbi:hypothetical protein C1645_828069 [Glomus cerebriforme]|uniref:Uncharacterized protein n=1 Tax=Glomus cerebriforme TaxID=658196 RepID=A0A397SRJ2_9GLOM|nr:hypothetical protein C1645_828069 [Glomus cerebriforme]